MSSARIGIPPAAARECVAHGAELRLPAEVRAEIPRERISEHRRRLAAFTAHAGEVQLVKERRIEHYQFFTLESVDHITRRLFPIERLEFFGNGVELAQRAAIVIFVK